MKLLITGAAGFIGSNLMKHCAQLGHAVKGVDNMSNGYVEFLGKDLEKELYVTDFSDPELLRRIVKQEFDVVIHLAAQPRVSFSVEHPFQTNDTNVTKSLHLLNACRGNVKRIVFASSSSVYGLADVRPTPPSTLKAPKSPYALQKWIIEEYLRLYNELYGLESTCLRFFNVFGRHQLGNNPYACAVGAWLTAILLNKPLRSDGDGTQSRDLCHVDNVIDACIRAASHEGALNAAAFNVACGESTTNNQILMYLRTRHPKLVINDAPWRPGDVMHTLADISDTKNVLGYRPLVDVWDGIDEMAEWYEKNAEWIKYVCS